MEKRVRGIDSIWFKSTLSLLLESVFFPFNPFGFDGFGKFLVIVTSLLAHPSKNRVSMIHAESPIDGGNEILEFFILISRFHQMV
jgi:hypothetical protein